MFEFLYKNIGNKIKNLAKVLFISEVIGFVIAGIFMLSIARDVDTIDFMLGILFIICAPIVAWVSSLFLYAFGDLLEDVHAIRKNINHQSAGRWEYTDKCSTADSGSDTSADSGSTQESVPAPASPQKSYLKERKWAEACERYGDVVGQCENCGKKKVKIVYAEYADLFGKAKKNMCFECFCSKDCTYATDDN